MINPEILGNSSSVVELKKLIETVAMSDTSVLISGESGTGKELIAKNLHSLSRRSKHKFVAVNCAAIPRDLIESELFGHKKGSFTGAIGDRLGRFELANGGTLFWMKLVIYRRMYKLNYYGCYRNVLLIRLAQ